MTKATGGALPAPITSFIGRRRELLELAGILGSTRLLTLTGPGGSGKTRLAIELAGRRQDLYPAGIVFVDLAPLSDPDLLPEVVTSAAGSPERSDVPAVERLISRFSDGPALLLLDNCEHLVAACAALAGRLLESCPGLSILATSRESIGLIGELTWPLEPLPASDAHLLFADRARLSRPGFSLDERSAPLVAAICTRLEGIPLALELAAARLRSVSAAELASRLEDRFSALDEPVRAPAKRHQTLRAAMDWSYDLLTAAEQRVFARASVFAGSFDLSAAAAVCGGDLQMVTRLVEKSMIQLAEPGRYRMLETLRQYGIDRLQTEDDAAGPRRHHALHFTGLVEQAWSEYFGPRLTEWLDRLALDLDNIRTALAWAHEAEPVLELRLAASAWPYWSNRGHVSEGRQILARAIEAAPARTASRARALSGASSLARWQNDIEAALLHARESREIAREVGDARAEAEALDRLGTASAFAGDEPGSRAYLEESLVIWRRLGDVGGIATVLFRLGLRFYGARDLAASRALFSEAAEMQSEVGGLMNGAMAQAMLGLVQAEQGEVAAGRERLRQALLTVVEMDWHYGVAIVLDAVAGLAVVERQPRRALQLNAAAERLRASSGQVMGATYYRYARPLLERARRQLPARQVDQARAEGERMTLEEVLAYALTREERMAPPPLLTPREQEVAGLVAEGLTDRQIAAQLHVSQRTAEGHVEQIRNKLGFSSRAQIGGWLEKNRYP